MIDPNTRIGAVTLAVANLARVIAFYRDVIGLRVWEQYADTATLGTAEQVLIHLCQLPASRPAGRACGLYHLALRVPSRKALADWYQHYVAVGLPQWQGASDHGVSAALYLSDPEGNGIEITCDYPQTDWQVAIDGTITLYARPLDLPALLRIATNTRWQDIAPATDLGHIHLRVADLAAAKTFYVDLLGFALKTELPNAALFVAAGDYHHHIGLNVWQTRHAPAAVDDTFGLARFELQVPTEATRQALVSQLHKAGCPVDLTDPSSPTIRDPFNLLIEFQVNAGLQPTRSKAASS